MGSAAGIVSDQALEAELLHLTNEARLGLGLGALESDEALARAARAHAAEMAELGYFSHTSPVTANATLGLRAAQAGSFALTLDENLALVASEGAANAAVKGWLESPGHRANLLSPEFSHVGFGSARYPDGRLAVAQVFALEPAPLAGAELVSVLAETVTLDVTLELSRPAEVAIFFGTRSSRSAQLVAGRQLLHVPLSEPPTLPLAVQLGVRASGESFILQHSGWLQPSGWEGEPAVAGHSGQLLGVALRSPLTRQYEVRLTFSHDPGLELVAWQGEYLVATETSGTRLTLTLPEPENDAPLYLGVPQGEGTYRALYGFLPQLTDTPRLLPASAQD